MNSPVRPYNAGRAEEGARSSCRRSTTSSSRRSPSRATGRRRRSTRSRRAGSGPASRRRRTAWSTRSAASIAPSRSPRSARRLPADSDVELVTLSAAEELLRAAHARSCQRVERVGGDRRVAVGAICRAASSRLLRALRGPSAMFRRGEAARADAVHVLALTVASRLSGHRGHGSSRRAQLTGARVLVAYVESEPLSDDPLQRLAIDLDLHLLLRLHHVGAEEAIAAIGEQLLAERVLVRREIRRRRLPASRPP